jgi:nitrogen fixation-related uncharacterized protein|tara:strand:+ start:489 stop:692 length:204 start_codon:yes stop_codon:yes gene_type:complete
MKKEYYLPLAIIIGAIIIGLFIYLGTTLQYRDMKAVCEESWGKKTNNKNTKELIVQVCVKRGPALQK